jgi:hypothetical protein
MTVNWTLHLLNLSDRTLTTKNIDAGMVHTFLKTWKVGNSPAITTVSGTTSVGHKSVASYPTIMQSSSFFNNLWKGYIGWHADTAQTNTIQLIWVPWQGHQLAYRQCANTIQLIKYPDRIVTWHRECTVKSKPHYSTSTVLPLNELCNNSSVLSECTAELSVLYSFSLSPNFVRLFWKLSQLQWWETRSQPAA